MCKIHAIQDMNLGTIIKSILHEGKYDLTTNQMKTWFFEGVSKYFPEYKDKIGKDWPMPIFEVKSHSSYAGWFKVTKWSSDRKAVECKISVNKDLIDNEKYRSIVLHELIHYIQSNVYSYNQYATMSNGGHDSFFYKYLEAMNAKEGSNFIKKSEDISSWGTIGGGQEFWVYGIRDRKGRIMLAYSRTERPDVVELLKRQIKLQGWDAIYSFKSNDMKYRIGKITTVKGKIRLAVEIPTDQTGMEQELAQYEI